MTNDQWEQLKKEFQLIKDWLENIESTVEAIHTRLTIMLESLEERVEVLESR